MNKQQILIGGRKKVFSDEIIQMRCDSNYSYVFLKSGKKHHVATTLKILENRLNAFNFFRPNRSMLVNMEYVTAYNAEDAAFIMFDKQKVKLSRRRNKKYLELYNRLKSLNS